MVLQDEQPESVTTQAGRHWASIPCIGPVAGGLDSGNHRAGAGEGELSLKKVKRDSHCANSQ